MFVASDKSGRLGTADDDWAKVAPPNVVMEWATHSSLNTTMKYCSKVSPGDEQIGQVKMFKRKPEAGGAATGWAC